MKYLTNNYKSEPAPYYLLASDICRWFRNETYKENTSDNGTTVDEEKAKKELEEIEHTYKLPIDTILQTHIPIQCEGYSTATLAVFNELKRAHPNILKNTYMTTQSSYGMGHVWDMVIDVQAPTEANVAFIDATADDPDWAERDTARESFMEELGGLHRKGIIDTNTFYALTLQYEKSGNMPTRELRSLLINEWQLQQPGDIFPKNYVQVIEAFLARPDAEIDLDGKVDKSLLLNASKKLYDYYIDPKSTERPEDWRERAQLWAEKIISLDVHGQYNEEERKQLRTIPQVPS